MRKVLNKVEVDFINGWEREGKLAVEPSEISPGVPHGRNMLLAICDKNDDGGMVFILDSDVFPSSVQDLEKKSRAMIGIKRGSSAQIGVDGEFIAEVKHIPTQKIG